MITRAQQNLNQLADVAGYLGPLLDEFVFVGGCVVGLLIDDPLAPEIRPTYDVDTIVDIVTRSDYHRLENKLRKLGFEQSIEVESPICAWFINNIRIDIVPTQKDILGFGNPWYKDAIKNCLSMKVNQHEIRVISPPYFIATKISAFHDRGNNDVYSSHDLEDIIAVIDGRSSLLDEIDVDDGALQKFIAKEMKALLEHPEFEYALPGYVVDSGVDNARLKILWNRIRGLADSK